MDNYSTRNGGPLSLADMLTPLERIREGMPQASLSLFEVGKLTFPGNAKLQRWLVNILIDNAKTENLPVYGNPAGWQFNKSNDRYWNYGDKDPFPKVEGHEVPPCGQICYSLDAKPSATYLKSYNGGACLVSHPDYFAFLKTPLARALGIPEPEWPAPAAKSIPPLETSLLETPISPARPATVAQGGAAEKEAALLALLDEVDHRAAEQGAGFNRDSLPGTKAEFQKLLNAYCPAFKYIQLGKYAKGKCKFQSGVQPKHGKGAAIWALFPEYCLKLG